MSEEGHKTQSISSPLDPARADSELAATWKI